MMTRGLLAKARALGMLGRGPQIQLHTTPSQTGMNPAPYHNVWNHETWNYPGAVHGDVSWNKEYIAGRKMVGHGANGFEVIF